MEYYLHSMSHHEQFWPLCAAEAGCMEATGATLLYNPCVQYGTPSCPTPSELNEISNFVKLFEYCIGVPVLGRYGAA